MKRRMLFASLAALLAVLLALPVLAHPGRTDSKGGHFDHSSGTYHYHHGYPAHQHRDLDGDGKPDCPYDFDDKTNHSSGSSSGSSSSSRITPTVKPTEDPADEDEEYEEDDEDFSYDPYYEARRQRKKWSQRWGPLITLGFLVGIPLLLFAYYKLSEVCDPLIKKVSGKLKQIKAKRAQRQAKQSPAMKAFRANLRKIHTLYRCRFSFKRNQEAGKPISDASYVARGCFILFVLCLPGRGFVFDLVNVFAWVSLFIPYIGTLTVLALWILGIFHILATWTHPLIPILICCAALAARLIAMTVRTVKFLRR